MQKPIQSSIEHAYDILRTEKVNPLGAIFAPKSVAVIGASEKADSVGRTLIHGTNQAEFAIVVSDRSHCD